MDAAEVLEDWWPTDRGVRVRGGLLKSATTGGNAVVSLFTYNDPASPALFAATATAIYDMSGLDPNTAPAADVTGQTAGYYAAQQIGTVGGSYLYVVNGADAPQLYDGTSWQAVTGASSPISITGATTSTFSAVCLYRNRLFFVEKDSLRAWYLPVDSVGGAAQSVSLAGVFQRGGSLLFGATWSADSGSGLDDRIVFVSTEGEVAVYEGSDPSSSSDWNLVGRYDAAKPLGANAAMQAGGDLIIATVDGILSISEIIRKDPAALSLSAVSRPIEDLWTYEARRATSPIELVKWTDRSLAVVTLPDAVRTLVVHLQTGGWGIARNWTATCATTFLGKCYIGQSDGVVAAIDETGLDIDTPYTARYCHAFSDFGSPTAKAAQQVRFVFYAGSTPTLKASVGKDYNTDFPAAPNAADVTADSDYLVWDTSNWDEGLWWDENIGEATGAVTTQWRSVAGNGHSLAPQLQITSGQAAKPQIELIRTDMTFREGRVVA